ncbi:hypothetical protein FPSM_00168 [Flavobacterium psychrophilum]|nr:hypothetical protein FPSM_00168 [Flavobacterium psychrophilum]
MHLLFQINRRIKWYYNKEISYRQIEEQKRFPELPILL